MSRAPRIPTANVSHITWRGSLYEPEATNLLIPGIWMSYESKGSFIAPLPLSKSFVDIAIYEL